MHRRSPPAGHRSRSGASDYLVKLPDRLELAARVRLHSEAHARLVERNAAFAALEEANAALARERELVALLDEIFTTFDQLAAAQGIEKIKTIGDAWMAAAGLPEPRADHAAAMAGLAVDLVAAFERLAARRGLTIRLRVGIHSGPVVAGVIGRDRFAYDLWGDTVNLASRMEAHGEPGRIHLSVTTAALVGEAFETVPRGEIVVKGKGPVPTAFLIGRTSGRLPTDPASR